MQKKWGKWKIFIILCWINFCFTIFPKKLAKKGYQTFIFFDVGLASAELSGAATPFYQDKTNISDQCQKIKSLITFFSKFFRNNVNNKCERPENSEDILFYTFFCNKIKSYSSVHSGLFCSVYCESNQTWPQWSL